MKSFVRISRELNEAKVKLPSGHKELKTDIVKVGGKPTTITYTTAKGRVSVFVNGSDFTGGHYWGGSPYKDLAAAEKEFKAIIKTMQQMAEEGVTIEEIINEINSRV